MQANRRVLNIEQVQLAKLQKYVNEKLLPQLFKEQRKTISESTAIYWLKALGYQWKRYTKGVYVDGHERPDVVKTREAFVNKMLLEILL